MLGAVVLGWEDIWLLVSVVSYDVDELKVRQVEKLTSLRLASI